MAATALLGSCGEPQLLTVERYLSQCASIMGKPVRVAGYISDCGGYSCLLYPNRSQPLLLDKSLKDIRLAARAGDEETRARLRDEINRLFSTLIGIGWSEQFDRKAQSFQNSYVVISGRVDDENCSGLGGTDRSYGVMPTDIRAWTVSEGAPANTN